MTKDERIAELEREVERLKKIKVPEKVVAYRDEPSMTTVINGVKFNQDQLEIINNLRLIQTQPEIYKQLRHEICEKIRNKALALCYYVPLEIAEYFGGNCYLVSKSDLEKIINQIEREEMSRWVY